MARSEPESFLRDEPTVYACYVSGAEAGAGCGCGGVASSRPVIFFCCEHLDETLLFSFIPFPLAPP
jgi:hypothetical protein